MFVCAYIYHLMRISAIVVLLNVFFFFFFFYQYAIAILLLFRIVLLQNQPIYHPFIYDRLGTGLNYMRIKLYE